MNDISLSALAAMAGLRNGDIQPLADYLEEESFGTIDPFVIRALLQSIVGSHKMSDFRLALVKHPDIKHHKQSRSFRFASFGKECKTALMVRRHGGHMSGLHDSAIAAAMDKLSLPHGTVQEHWKRQRRYIAFCIAHGVFEDPYKG